MSGLPGNLQPLMGPRRLVGRLIAGEAVPKQEQLTDQSDWVCVYVDRDVVLPPLEALGFIAQCSICPQKAVLHMQAPAGWTCPRCTDILAQPEHPVGEHPCLPTKPRG